MTYNVELLPTTQFVIISLNETDMRRKLFGGTELIKTFKMEKNIVLKLAEELMQIVCQKTHF